ncbi:MAG: hypothetical protein QGH42_04230, partial [Kiritimatiellia bacterium]|nr:hypothetical protein [Kiritimatiellia bacterium]
AAINSCSTFLALVLEVSVLVWVQQYLILRISPEEYSLLPLLATVLTILLIMAQLLTSGLGRFLTVACAEQDMAQVNRIISSILPFILGLGVMVVVGGALLIASLDVVFKIEPRFLSDARLITGMLLLVFLARLLTTPFALGLYVYQKFVWMSVVEFSGGLLRLALLLALLSNFGARVLWVATAQMVAFLAMTGAKVVLSLRQMPLLRPSLAAFDWKTVREVLRFSGWLTVGKTGLSIARSADLVFLNRCALAPAVGSFHLASLIPKHLAVAMVALTGPLEPAITAMQAADRQDQLMSTFYRVGRLSLWFVGLIIVPLLMLRVPLCRLYLGARFETYEAVPVLLVMIALAWVPMCFVDGLEKLAVAKGRARGYSVILMVSHVAHIALSAHYVFVLGLGPVGVGLAGLVSMWGGLFLGFLPLGVVSFGVSLRSYLPRVVLRGLGPWLVGALTCHYVSSALPPTSWLSLVAVAVIANVAYCLGVLFCSTEGDKEDVLGIMKSALSRFGGT